MGDHGFGGKIQDLSFGSSMEKTELSSKTYCDTQYKAISSEMNKIEVEWLLFQRRKTTASICVAMCIFYCIWRHCSLKNVKNVLLSSIRRICGLRVPFISEIMRSCVMTYSRLTVALILCSSLSRIQCWKQLASNIQPSAWAYRKRVQIKRWLILPRFASRHPNLVVPRPFQGGSLNYF